MTKQTKSYLYTASAIMLWSTVASAFKFALRDLDYVKLLFYASATSLVSLFIIILIQGKFKLLLGQFRQALPHSLILGLINPTLYYLVLFKAYSLLPAQEAQPLNWTWPITLSLLSAPLLKQRLKRGTYFALGLGFLGVLVISTKGNPLDLRFTNLTGDLLAVGSSILWALYWIFNLRDERDPVVKLFYCFLYGCLYNVIAVLAFSDFHFPSTRGILLAGYVGLFEMGITFVFWLKALSLSKSSASVGILAYITPFVSLVFIHFVLGETILLSSVAGLTLIVGGILLQTFTGKSN